MKRYAVLLLLYQSSALVSHKEHISARFLRILLPHDTPGTWGSIKSMCLNMFVLQAETLEDLHEWKAALEEALSNAPNAALVTGQNGMFKNDQINAADASSDQSNFLNIWNIGFCLHNSWWIQSPLPCVTFACRPSKIGYPYVFPKILMLSSILHFFIWIVSALEPASLHEPSSARFGLEIAVFHSGYICPGIALCLGYHSTEIAFIFLYFDLLLWCKTYYYASFFLPCCL